VSVLTPQRFDGLAAYAGHFGLPLPPPGFVDEHDDVLATAGVYVITSRTDFPLYTGSARRPEDPRGLVHRMREHLRRPDRRRRWLRAWLIPVSPEATLRQVHLIEGMVGVDLGTPENQRLPTIIRVHSTTGKGIYGVE
jgi:hypothetical protein